MGFLQVGALASIAGNVVYGYALTSETPISQEACFAGVLNYLALPLGLSLNGLCNVSDEFGKGPVDYANSPRRNGMSVQNDSAGLIHFHTADNNPKRKIGNLEVGLTQGTLSLAINTLALGAGFGAGLLTRKFS
jgi:hypothetical protein